MHYGDDGIVEEEHIKFYDFTNKYNYYLFNVIRTNLNKYEVSDNNGVCESWTNQLDKKTHEMCLEVLCMNFKLLTTHFTWKPIQGVF